MSTGLIGLKRKKKTFKGLYGNTEKICCNDYEVLVKLRNNFLPVKSVGCEKISLNGTQASTCCGT